MEVEEHFYADDPSRGHPDVRTTLKDTEYFFLGNGHILAAVQVCKSGEGTPLGLALAKPDKFGPKRRSLTCEADRGLRPTMLRIELDDGVLLPDPQTLDASWQISSGIPVVQATWHSSHFRVVERFSCPDTDKPALLREIHLANTVPTTLDLRIVTGIPGKQLEKSFSLSPAATLITSLQYELVEFDRTTRVQVRWTDHAEIARPAEKFWRNANEFQSDSSLLDRLFLASRNQLPVCIAANGAMDASIWQYNLEWVRDQSMVAIGLVLAGYFEPARTMLSRLLSEFVSPSGDIMDSSRKRPPEEMELDQNGELLLALRYYVNWTGDLAFIYKHWPRIRALANYPLQPQFRHSEVFLLHNQREYWERHRLHGIQDGMELAYQFFVALGLESAAYLARLAGKKVDHEKWAAAAKSLKRAMLQDEKYALVANDALIKRRNMAGEVQQDVHVKPDAGLPQDIPLFEGGEHLLNPDSSTALPIAFEFIPPRSNLAAGTLAQLEKLWNQRWQGGGYSRYNCSSEPDSPGPWPFASLFIARAYFEAGDDAKVWRVLHWLGRATGGNAGSWFEYCGPRPVPPYPQIGVVPWTWAEMLMLFVHHMLGVRPESRRLLLRPRLLSGLSYITSDLRLRNHRVRLKIQKVQRGQEAGFHVDDRIYPFASAGLELPVPEHDLEVLALVP